MIFADAHGIEPATYAEGMGEGLFVHEAIKAIPLLEFEIILGGQEAEDGVDSEGRIAPNDKLGAITGREDDDFVDAFTLRQHGENLGLPASTHPKAFANFDCCRPMIKADDD